MRARHYNISFPYRIATDAAAAAAATELSRTVHFFWGGGERAKLVFYFFSYIYTPILAINTDLPFSFTRRDEPLYMYATFHTGRHLSRHYVDPKNKG